MRKLKIVFFILSFSFTYSWAEVDASDVRSSLFAKKSKRSRKNRSDSKRNKRSRKKKKSSTSNLTADRKAYGIGMLSGLASFGDPPLGLDVFYAISEKLEVAGKYIYGSSDLLASDSFRDPEFEGITFDSVNETYHMVSITARYRLGFGLNLGLSPAIMILTQNFSLTQDSTPNSAAIVNGGTTFSLQAEISSLWRFSNRLFIRQVWFGHGATMITVSAYRNIDSNITASGYQSVEEASQIELDGFRNQLNSRRDSYILSTIGVLL